MPLEEYKLVYLFQRNGREYFSKRGTQVRRDHNFNEVFCYLSIVYYAISLENVQET